MRPVLWTKMLAFLLMPTGHDTNQESVPNRSIFYSCTHVNISSVSQSFINNYPTIIPPLTKHLPLPKVSQGSNFFKLPSSPDLCCFLAVYTSNYFFTYASLKQNLKIQRLFPHKTLLSQLTNS